MFTVFTHPLAERDIEDIVDWYNNQKDGLGSEFLSELEVTLKYLDSNPLSFPERYDKTRISRTGRRFPYYIHFEVIEKAKKLVIFGVFHGHRNPGIWKKRLSEI